MKRLLVEGVFQVWMRFERIVAWRMARKAASGSEERSVWKYRREIPNGILGLYIEHKPQHRLSRWFWLVVFWLLYFPIIRPIERAEW